MTEWNDANDPVPSPDPLIEFSGTRKRRAEGTPPARDGIPVDAMEERFDQARKRIQHSTSQSHSSALPARPLALPSENTTEVTDEVTPFNYLEIPAGTWSSRCALAVHGVNGLSMLGSTDATSIDFSMDACLDAGRMGLPKLTLAVHVANPLTGRPLVKKQPSNLQQQKKKNKGKKPTQPAQHGQASQYETFSYHWYPTISDSDGKLMIETFDYQSFLDWCANADPHTQQLPSVQAIGASKDAQYTEIITCQLRSPVFSGCPETPIWKHLPATISDQLENLQRDVKVSFFMRHATGARAHLAYFRRRVIQNIGILSQYYDAVTGDYTLSRIDSAQPMEEVGGGVNLNADGTPRELPMFENFINLSHFQIFSALGPIREARQANAVHPPASFQRRLEAVNDFCESQKPALVNLRHLLMNSVKSNPSQVCSSNISGPSSAVSTSFASLLEEIKSDLGDPSQSMFLDKLITVKDDVLALTGPAGSGKNHLLRFAIWIILLLGHKILVASVDEILVEDLLAQVASAKPAWLPETTLLKLTQSDDSPKAQIHAPALDGLFTTLQHAGSDQLKHINFKPSVIIICQAGKASFSSMCIPITGFSSWETLLLVGDWHQSGPWIYKGTKSEVALYSKTPVIETLEKMGTNTVTLQLQHRMPRSVASFPAKIFYGGEFKFHQGSLVGDTRRKVRNTASKYYAIKGKKGSEYFVLDVPNTKSRLGEDETSPRNYGNATAIEELVQNLNKEGIPADDIVVLCFYSSQVALLADMVRANDDGTKGCREVRTIDSFHCRQAKVVIVDFVAADSITSFVMGKKAEGFSKSTLSDYIRDHHRICLALTRASDGLIVVGQVALFVAQAFTGGTLGNTLFWMVSDAMERQLVYSAEHIVDNHPTAIFDREINDTTAEEREEDVAAALKNYHAFVRNQLKYGRSQNQLGGKNLS
ncbi:MAG: hypothetical protein Q9176_008029 [Flavoplaca citrina]